MHRENQHAIITGGSSGIGRAIALRLAQQGAHVSIIARSPEKLQQAQSDIEQARQSPSQRILALSADVGDRLQAEHAIHSAIETSGSPHLLITSAGIAYPNYFQKIPIDVFEQTMAVNYFGSLYCIRAALPSMENAGGGQIGLISSGAGLIGLYGYSAYCPSKFAVRGLAEALRAELKPVGIQVSIAYPPDTDTPQFVEENKTKPAATKEITAAAKLWKADDIARTMLIGMEKGQFEISPGLEMGVLTRLHSLISPILNRYFDHVVKKTTL